MSVVNLDETDLKKGVLGLVVALVEIIKETLRLQALRRVEEGSLTEEEEERLGNALLDLEDAIENIKVEMGIAEAVKTVREGLDNLADRLLDPLLEPDREAQEAMGVY